MNGAKDFINDYILISVSAFLISVILTPIIRKSCQRRQVLDFPTNPRKLHAKPVPRLGGIAIYFAFFLPLSVILLTDGSVHELFARHLDTLLSLFVTSTLVFAIGFYDDIRGATVTQKLVVQFVAAVLIYFLGFKIQLLAVPFIGPFSLGILGLPVTLFWVVGVTNALNFIDGVDGLACGVGFFSVSTMFILSLFLHNTITAFFAVALAGGIFGFALYNFAPASIFMGDSGSLFIGFIIATISLHGSQKSSTVVVLLLPIVALGVPIADTVFAIIRRLANGYSPFAADGVIVPAGCVSALWCV
jgi:UDP-GlcNAc:undecaprenyl-phosphate GlcNAc-1-phosphate transferase